MEEKDMLIGWMSGQCSAISGFLVLIAGMAFLLLALGYIDATTAYMFGGAALGLYALCSLIHLFEICPRCKDKKAKLCAFLKKAFG